MVRSSRNSLLIANWKMYIESPKEATEFARRLARQAPKLKSVEFALAPAFPLLPPVASALKNTKSIALAAQTLSPSTRGAHTGEVSSVMLSHSGVSMVIVGHSERRAAGESDAQIAEELMRAQEQKLRAVLCIGELSRDESGGHFAFLSEQLEKALGASGKHIAAKSLVVAYEPVWAIGKTANEAMKPEELRETAIFIRKKLSEIYGREAGMKVKVLYGGSVEPENARALIEGGDVAGFLIGHASAEINSFLAIAAACAPAPKRAREA